jgi:hypothetical protein
MFAPKPGVPNDRSYLAWSSPHSQIERVSAVDARGRSTGLPVRSRQSGSFVLRQANGETTDFIMFTFWDSKDAIAKFAGDDIETAKYYKFDRDFLIELEPQVKHYELYEGSASG